MSPPIKVTVISGCPPCITKPADNVLNGLLCGLMMFGLCGLSVNNAPRLCRMKPYPGTVIPEPKALKLLFTQETMLPSLSAVDSTTVSPGMGKFASGPGVDARCGSTFLQSDAAWESESNFASGTAAKLGSALY